jgi:hypothetical protein
VEGAVWVDTVDEQHFLTDTSLEEQRVDSPSCCGGGGLGGVHVTTMRGSLNVEGGTGGSDRRFRFQRVVAAKYTVYDTNSSVSSRKELRACQSDF